MSASSHASTPARSTGSPNTGSTGKKQQKQQKSKANKAAASQQGKSPGSRFTPSKQDAQARHKEIYESDDASDDLFGDGRFDEWGNDTYENTQARRNAACVLENQELLMMYAAARSDSIIGTRNHFEKILCGFVDASADNDKDKSSSSFKEPKNQNSKPWKLSGGGEGSSSK